MEIGTMNAKEDSKERKMGEGSAKRIEEMNLMGIKHL